MELIELTWRVCLVAAAIDIGILWWFIKKIK